jgi:hypothetical protein
MLTINEFSHRPWMLVTEETIMLFGTVSNTAELYYLYKFSGMRPAENLTVVLSSYAKSEQQISFVMAWRITFRNMNTVTQMQ